MASGRYYISIMVIISVVFIIIIYHYNIRPYLFSYKDTKSSLVLAHHNNLNRAVT